MISLHKYPTISQSILGVLKVYRRAWNTIIEKLVKKNPQNFESEIMQES